MPECFDSSHPSGLQNSVNKRGGTEPRWRQAIKQNREPKAHGHKRILGFSMVLLGESLADSNNRYGLTEGSWLRLAQMDAITAFAPVSEHQNYRRQPHPKERPCHPRSKPPLARRPNHGHRFGPPAGALPRQRRPF